MTVIRKKLIEVALPLEAVNAACVLEKQPFTAGHPRSMHIWWARRPLAAARAVIFAQMVDDPSSHPDLFPTEKAQDKERQRLFRIIEELVKWENTTNETVLQRARDEIWQSWRSACADNADHPRAKELFDRYKLPAFHDPFAGGGALPLEAQRLGLEAYASDLNPVAVLICKAMIEIPPKFAGRAPVNPESRQDKRLMAREWRGAQGLAEDVRYYGKWMRDEAEKRIGQLYPKVEVTAEMARDRPDLKPLIGQKLTVIAWLWARTVKSPNPAYANVDVPLASTFMLSTKEGREAYVEPVIERDGYRFTVKMGKPKNTEMANTGTKLARGANFRCLMSGTPIEGNHIKAEGKAGRMGARLMAIVAEGDHGRIYLSPSEEHVAIAEGAHLTWKPELKLSEDKRAFWTPAYGITHYGDLFTNRQLVALTTFSDLVQEAREQVKKDALAAGIADDGKGLAVSGLGATAYSEAITLYLALATSRWCDLSNALCSWNGTNQNVRALFARQGIPMIWDFAELSPFSKTGPWFSAIESSVGAFPKLSTQRLGFADQADAAEQKMSAGKVVSTDPPYYDNIGYADLSDFFYVWLRPMLKTVYPDLFATLAVPKAEELVATPYRHGSKQAAEGFFLAGMTRAMHRLAEQAHPLSPITIYYAFKQAESKDDGIIASTGWDTFLEAVIQAGFIITGTWPIRTERGARSVGLKANALASSIILVCRSRTTEASLTSRREFISVLKSELPTALTNLQFSNIAPVDLQQSSIGPGMAVFTRYSKVLNADGSQMTVREALALINQVLDEVLAAQEGDFDADTRWAVAWFDQYCFTEGEYGVAEVLSKAKNTSVKGMVEAGIVVSRGGKVRLLRPDELRSDWDPTRDQRLTAWEITHQLLRVLEQGEGAAAELAARIGSKAETARELAYRLYNICERRKRAKEAIGYNALVQSWPEISRLAADIVKTQPPTREQLNPKLL